MFGSVSGGRVRIGGHREPDILRALDRSQAFIEFAPDGKILGANGKPFKVVKFVTDITAKVLARREAERVSALVDRNLAAISHAVATANARAKEGIDLYRSLQREAAA